MNQNKSTRVEAFLLQCYLSYQNLMGQCSTQIEQLLANLSILRILGTLFRVKRLIQLIKIVIIQIIVIMNNNGIMLNYLPRLQGNTICDSLERKSIQSQGKHHINIQITNTYWPCFTKIVYNRKLWCFHNDNHDGQFAHLPKPNPCTMVKN